MTTDWRTVTVADLALGGERGVAGGPFGSALGRKDYLATGVPVIRGAQLSGERRFRLDDFVYVASDKADRHTGNLAYPGDVIITQRGTLGQVGLIPFDAPYKRFLLSQSQMKITANPSVADAEFLYYTFRSPLVRQRLIDQGMTSGVPHINLGTLREFALFVPEVGLQRSIAKVLRLFDELIETNSRRIELLEDIARSVYREWFVRFRHSGHDDADVVDSDIGQLPKGWRVTTLGEAANWQSGGTPSTGTSLFWDGDIPWISSGTLTSILLHDAPRRLTAAGVAAGSRTVERDALLFVVRGMSLVREFRVGIAERRLAFGQDCKALTAVEGIDPLYLAFTVLDRQREVQGMVELSAHGTGKLSTDRVKAVAFPLPPPAVQDQFRRVVQPMREQMATLIATQRNATAARDVLLPRLVSGRLDISDVDLDGLACTGFL